MTDTTGWRVRWTPRLVVSVVALAVLSLGITGLAASQVVVGPGTVFEASDDGPTVEITEELELDSPFSYPDDRTVDLSPYATFESEGDTNVTVDSMDGEWLALTTHDIAAGLTVDATDKQPVTLDGTVSQFEFRDAAFAPNDGNTDVVYEATDIGSLVVADTGLDDGTRVLATDAKTGQQYDDTTVEDGAVTFGNLPDGDVALDLRTQTEAVFEVSITDTNEPVTERGDIAVTVQVENTGEKTDTQPIELKPFDGSVVDDVSLTLDGGAEKTVTLTWPTALGDAGTDDVIASSDDDSDAAAVTVRERDAVLEVDEFSEQLPDAEAGDDYGAVEVTVGETENVETEDLVVALQIEGRNEGELFEEEINDSELRAESGTFRFDVGVINASDDYTATVIADADNADQRTQAEPFTVAKPPEFNVSIDDAPKTAIAGENVTVEATVVNDGDISDTQTVGFSVDGVERGATSLSLDGGENHTLLFNYDTDEGDIGSLNLTVASDDDAASRTIQIDEPPKAEFSIDDVGAPDQVTAGDVVSVNATVENVGDATGQVTIEFLLEEVPSTTGLELGPGESQVVTFDVDTTTVGPGNYTYTVLNGEDELTGRLAVEERENDTADDAGDGADNADDDGAGFGVTIAALVLFGVAVTALRRRTD